MRDHTNFKLWLVRWVPRSVLYWCVIQAWVYASSEEYTNLAPDEITWIMVCNHLSGDKT